MSLVKTIALLASAATAMWAQFNSLATPSDGSAVYFTTTLRLQNTLEPTSGKVFVADERGVRLVESRWVRVPPAPYPAACVLGRLFNFGSVELTADGRTMALGGSQYASPSCRGYHSATLLRGPAGTREIDGVLRLSANGRWALVDTTTSAFSQTTGSLVDLATGARTDFEMPWPAGIGLWASGRAVADDGTAVFSGIGRPYILRPGQAPQPFPYGNPEAISANGARVLYRTDAVHVVDLATGRDEQLSATGGSVGGVGLSDDGSRAAFVQNGQLYVADFGGGGARQVSNVPEGLMLPELSGNGKIAYSATATGRLVKIVIETGATTEIVARTPNVTGSGGIVDAGGFTTISGWGFSEQSFTASAPLPLMLGGVTVTVGGRQVPISRVTPTSIDVLIPWEMASDTPYDVVVSAPPSNSPFESPRSTLQVMGGPRAGSLYRQDWPPITDLTVHAGEIIHVFAVGLGAVTPEVPAGSAAPSSEPLARLASPMSCANATVLFAGLQPGALTRVYQVDLQIGSKTGYQQFPCTIGETSFAFLTLNVVP